MHFFKVLVLVLILCCALTAPAMAADQLNVNTATEKELAALPGVGPELAKGIVEYRENVGDVKKMDELLEVKGVTPDVLKKIQEVLKIEAIEGAECNC
ncbi:MAG: helix-hairpin-helix domain-containing protein [Desulfovibrionaceae bacterium]